jgi:TonB family protein
MAKDKDDSGEVAPPSGVKVPPRPALFVGRKVVVLQSVDGDRTYQFNKDRIVIGQVISADVRLTGDWIAPIHAVLEVRKSQDDKYICTIYDLASESGVFVNDKKIISQGLKDGDTIKLGRYQLKFSLEDADKVASRQKRKIKDSGDQQLYMDPKEDFTSLILQDEMEVEEIFDYRPAKKQAVEVVMSWRGTILDVEHYVNQKTITIGGSKACDFAVPPTLGPGSFNLLKFTQGRYVLNLHPKMSGVLQSHGEVIDIQNLTTKAAKGVEGGELPLEQDEFAKISVGEVDFYVSFTAAPPRLKHRRMFERDPYYYRVLATSVVFTAAIVGMLLSVDIPKDLEAEKIPERIATVLYQPEKFMIPPIPRVQEKKPEPEKVEPPKPKPTPKETVKVEIQPQKDPPKVIPKEMDVSKPKVQPKPAPQPTKVAVKAPEPKPVKAAAPKAQPAAKEGEGARAKGPEGTRGSQKAPPADVPQKKANRPSTSNTGTAGVRGNSQVPGPGNVDVLKGMTAQIQNVLGNTAGKFGSGGGKKLEGYGAFDTQGSGGAALSGRASGGGGNAEALGGLSDRGSGGGRVGTGKGAAGNASGIIGGQLRVGIRVGAPEEAVVMGAIDANAIEAALLAYRDNFRNCYEKEINAERPDLSGRVSTNFVIGSSGRVTQAGIESSTLKNERVERCIVGVIRRIPFPIPKGGGIVQVTYPFKFNPLKR